MRHQETRKDTKMGTFFDIYYYYFWYSGEVCPGPMR